jgi:5-methylthioribose kinase
LLVLDATNAVPYLADRGFGPAASIRPLGGGVSNTVLLAETPKGRIVVKQALEKLRVEADWRSRPDRTLREADAIQAIGPLAPPGAVPAIRFVDRTNFIYAMDAAAEGAHDWKSELLAGRIETRVAADAARILGAILRATWRSPEWEARFGDQTVFDELRLDPYFRHCARRFPELADFFAGLIANCRERRVSLVHGDWSPKNLLVTPDAVIAIDFEVVHYGDPSFDTGFLLNHLLLKSIHRPADAAAYLACAAAFWNTLQPQLPDDAGWLHAATIEQLAGLLLARVAGKSPAEYLSSRERETAWRLGQRIIASRPRSIEEIWKWI